MNAPANLLAVTPALRERHADWKAIQRKRHEAGFDHAWEWAPAEGNARQLFIDAARDAVKEVRR